MSNEARLGREKLLARGLTAEVFTWGEDRVLKLFLRWVPEANAEREFAITQAIFAAGVCAPATHEMIKIADRHAIIFERVQGDSMLKRVTKKPWILFQGARQLAEWHARIHSHPAPEGLPSQREQLERWIDDAEDVAPAGKDLARRHAARLPQGTSLCHGDFHPGNILFGAQGPAIIDWSGATRGHPPADVARTSVLFESAKLPSETPFHINLLMKLSRRLLHACYLRRYFELRPCTMKEIETWRVPQRMAAPAWRARQKAAMMKAGLKSMD